MVAFIPWNLAILGLAGSMHVGLLEIERHLADSRHIVSDLTPY
jgi:hypothetical protein